MSELIELVFERVSTKEIWKCMDFLLKDSKVYLVKYVDIFGEETIKHDIFANDIGAIKIAETHHVLVKTSSLIIEKLKIYDADIWVEFYPSDNNHVDFLINFAVSDLGDFMTYYIPNIMLYAHNLSEKVEVENYYCGLEPAIDDETRFFTKTEIGPLKVSGAHIKPRTGKGQGV